MTKPKSKRGNFKKKINPERVAAPYRIEKVAIIAIAIGSFALGFALADLLNKIFPGH